MMASMSGADPSDSARPAPGAPGWLEQSYDAYPRIEAAFHAALDESLQPRGPDLLYDLVRDFGPLPGSLAVDVGCGEGKHSVQLAERFQFTVIGVDPLPRHIELASAALHPEVERLVRFELGAAEALPLADRTVDLIWWRDVLVHVADLDRAYAEFHRVLRAKGQAHPQGVRLVETLRPGPRYVSSWMRCSCAQSEICSSAGISALPRLVKA
jgi:SAM-dependent methyltransferase